MEITRALRAQGHDVQFAGLVDVEAAPGVADDRPLSALRRFLGAIKRNRYVYDIAQIGYNFYAVPKIMRLARRMKADAIYERHALFNVAGVVAARLLKLPIIVEVNSPLSMEQQRENAIAFVGAGEAMERWGLSRANKVLTVTTPLKDIMVGIGVKGDKIMVMPNGIDPAHFGTAARDPALEAKLCLTGKTVVGFVGWFREWHGIDRLIDAFKAASVGNDQLALLLIGDGPARAGLEAQIAKLGLEGRVIITGAASHDQVPKYLALVDIAMQPAANEYCCPMKVIEYMGMGKAIIAPDQPNLSELIEDGGNGLLFVPGDTQDMGRAIRNLAENGAERQRLGTNAQATIDARGLLWSANAARVAEMFRDFGAQLA